MLAPLLWPLRLRDLWQAPALKGADSHSHFPVFPPHGQGHERGASPSFLGESSLSPTLAQPHESFRLHIELLTLPQHQTARLPQFFFILTNNLVMKY